MKLRLSEPRLLIDIARIPGLAGIREKDGKIEIGAAHRAPRCGDVGAAAASVPGASPRRRRDRRPAGAQPRHARRQPRARRPGRRLSGRDARARRRDSPQGADGGARSSRRPTSSRICSRWTWRPTRSSPAVQFAPVRAAAYAKLHQRASHFAIVGVAAALEVSGGHDSDRRASALTGAGSHARAADGSGAGAARASRRRAETIAAAAALARTLDDRELGHPRQRGVSARDDPGVHSTRARSGAIAPHGRSGTTAAARSSPVRPQTCPAGRRRNDPASSSRRRRSAADRGARSDRRSATVAG